ncbi:MAG: transposase [Succinivibrio sp.]|nr:transposase [Succinivibrio sp.]
MATIYREKMVPIPEGAHINKHDMRVFIIVPVEGKPLRECPRVNIGKATAVEGMMYANEKYRFHFPALWKQYFGNDKLPEHVLHSGLYAMTLGIGYKTKLYPILSSVYGAHKANMLMDWAQYGILERSTAALTFPDRMAQQLRFSTQLYRDSALSEFFDKELDENHNWEFRHRWLEQCVANGVTGAWLSIDGSNHDCCATDAELPEQGASKSGKSLPVVSYLYAVSAEDGRPLSYQIYNGGKVDSKALQQMIALLEGHHIRILGILLDRGFCDSEVIKLLEEKHFDYLIMLKQDTNGHKIMLSRHASQIRGQVRYALSQSGMFGISDQVKLFNHSTEESCVHLIYDARNGVERVLTLIDKVHAGKAKLEEKIASGSDNLKVPEELEPYLTLTGLEEGTPSVSINYERWQHDVDIKGFSSLVSSPQMSADEANERYNLRSYCEIQFKWLKTELGADVSRNHHQSGIENKAFATFIAAITRSEIAITCKKLGYNTNQEIREVNRLILQLHPESYYTAIHDESIRQKTLLSEFGIIPESMDAIAAEVNARDDKEHPELRELPVPPSKQEKSKGGRPRKAKSAEPKTKGTPGRPKGSKNKKTLEREAKELKRQPGRPKGSKNKTPEQREAEKSKPRRSPGRPKGSRNKKTIEREEQQRKEREERLHPKRKPGRPPKNSQPQAIFALEDAMNKRNWSGKKSDDNKNNDSES